MWLLGFSKEKVKPILDEVSDWNSVYLCDPEVNWIPGIMIESWTWIISLCCGREGTWMWNVFPHRCVPCGCVPWRCVTTCMWDVFPVDAGFICKWMWDVFPMDVGHVHAASHLSHVWDQPGIHTWSVGQAGPGRTKPVTTFLVLLSPDRTELQRAMEHNSRLDKEILALRARVQTLDLERKAFLELVRIHQAKPTILG